MFLIKLAKSLENGSSFVAIPSYVPLSLLTGILRSVLLPVFTSIIIYSMLLKSSSANLVFLYLCIFGFCALPFNLAYINLCLTTPLIILWSSKKLAKCYFISFEKALVGRRLINSSIILLFLLLSSIYNPLNNIYIYFSLLKPSIHALTYSFLKLFRPSLALYQLCMILMYSSCLLGSIQ
jgi:hypothetical protein